MIQPQNISIKYDHLFSGIDQGTIKIPKFQQEFVWDKNQTAKLIDSIIKGFPIGTFIFWKTNEELRHHKDIGNAKLPTPRKGDVVQYILDGQQRITSLYAVRKGLIITKEGKEIDYNDICINLMLDPDDDEMVVVTDPPQDCDSISVNKLLKRKIKANPPSKYIKTFQRSNDTFDETMKSHLINVDSYDVLEDDYEKFIKKRSAKIMRELNKRLNFDNVK